jgi:Flp pilus assembly pilin Flp
MGCLESELTNFLKRDDGEDLIEYSLLLAALSVAFVAFGVHIVEIGR